MNSNLKIFEFTVLYIPYDKKDDAKKQGAKWDLINKWWYCDDKNELLIEKYKKRYIEVSYDDKDNAKENGCRWDFTNKKWYTYNSNQEY